MSPRKPMRQEKFPFGIAGVSVGEIERQVPAGEAPPLPTNDRLAVIGKSVPRINGRAKVTGAARFTVDIKLPGLLTGPSEQKAKHRLVKRAATVHGEGEMGQVFEAVNHFLQTVEVQFFASLKIRLH